jgi:hypothetical protein
MMDRGPDEFIDRYRKRAEAPDETSRVLGTQCADDARADSNDDDLPRLVDEPPDFVFPEQDANAAACSLEGPL